jgi:hypothetical protein
MNLLGKIFTVLILVISLVVMIVAMMVYATHRNWRTVSENLNSQLQAAQTQLQKQRDAYTRTNGQLQAEREAAQQDVSKLQSELQRRITENSQLQQAAEQFEAEVSQSRALLDVTESNNRALTTEVAELRQQSLAAIADRDSAFAKTTQSTTELHDVRNQLAKVMERQSQLLDQVARATQLLEINNIDPAGEIVPHVRGLVSATRREAGVQLVEITIGADDGVKPGQTVEVFRGSRYLGRIEILKTDPDRSVGRVIREYQQGPIQEDDDVATKLRVG